jgi:hypothetical protein
MLCAGLRIRAQTIKDEFDRSDSVGHLLLLYAQALATQIAQAVVCNHHHSVDQQVCGWLLHCLDLAIALAVSPLPLLILTGILSLDSGTFSIVCCVKP